MARWLSSEFSTTVTWNCRGRQMAAEAERKSRRHPAGAEAVVEPQALGGDAGEGGLRAAGDREDGEEADREHRRELDHRLEGDGGDDAVMALVLVERAGAEEDGEEREARRGPEGDDGVLLGVPPVMVS